MNTCQNCTFRKVLEGLHVCCNLPPVPAGRLESNLGVFPGVQLDWWCGQHSEEIETVAIAGKVSVAGEVDIGSQPVDVRVVL